MVYILHIFEHSIEKYFFQFKAIFFLKSEKLFYSWMFFVYTFVFWLNFRNWKFNTQVEQIIIQIVMILVKSMTKLKKSSKPKICIMTSSMPIFTGLSLEAGLCNKYGKVQNGKKIFRNCCPFEFLSNLKNQDW